ncbi:MAG: DUF6268 family outer membrane beta-barrel protein [Bacteroidia bacterium]
MKRKKPLLLTAVSMMFLFFSNRLIGQPYFDVANFYYQHSPDKSLFNSDKISLQTNYFNLSLKYGLKLKSDLLVINPFYENLKLNYADEPKQNLHGTGFFLTYFKQWKNPKWQTAFVAFPRINSDFKNIDGNDFQVGGVVLGILKKSETLSYKFGVYYNSDFFGPRVVPMIGIDWRPSDKVRIFGVLPVSLNFEYKLGKRFYTGAEIYFITTSYRYDDFYFLRVDDHHVKLYFDTYVTKHVVVSLQAGQSVLRKYQSGFRSGGETNYTNLDVNDGLLLRAGLIYRMRTDGEK